MNKIQIFTNSLSGLILIGTLISLPVAIAVQLSDGKTHFIGQPRLLSATSTFKEVNAFSSTYYFAIAHPNDASEPLQKLEINLKQGQEFPEFSLEETEAFEGTNPGAAKLPLGKIAQTQQTLTVHFNPPIPPGKTFTLALRPVHNPSTSGVYLFGVTAYPTGDNPQGQFLGFGRLHFYSNGGSFFWD